LGFLPILLLDDIFDKLDDNRVGRLLQLVSNHSFGQVLVTDTNLDRLEKIFVNVDVPIHYFEVSEGSLKVPEFSKTQNA